MEPIRRKNPINRNNLYFSNRQRELQERVACEYINKVVNQTVVVYQVDRNATQIDDIYNEANFSDLVFKTPVEINVLYRLDTPELQTYDTRDMKGFYVKMGKLTFSVMERELKEQGCDIQRGDYIGLQVTETHMEFFKVTDDGRLNYDNRHTMFGTTPYYRSIVCVTVDDASETVNM